MGVLDLPMDAYWVDGKEGMPGFKEMLTLEAPIHPILRHTYQDLFSPLSWLPHLRNWLYYPPTP